MEFNVSDKVRAGLGVLGTVESIESGKSGEVLVRIRWSTGSLGAYGEEELRRYKIVRI